MAETDLVVVRSPFDDADADIIFRSSDGVDFRLYKDVIAKASVVFRDMLTLPANSDPLDGPQTVSLTENANTLEGLLRLCYPVERPHFTQFDHAVTVLEAAKKYQMDAILATLKASLLEFLDVEPLRIYAIGYLLPLSDIARVAARRLLNEPQFAEPATPPPEFNVLPSIALSYVFAYRKRCIDAALAVLVSMNWMVDGLHGRQVHFDRKNIPDMSSSWVWLSCAAPRQHTHPMYLGEGSRRHPYYPQEWFSNYMQHIKVELALRPVGQLVTDVSNLEPFLSQAAQCTTCAPKALGDIMKFSQILASKIEETVSKVELELPF